MDKEKLKELNECTRNLQDLVAELNHLSAQFKPFRAKFRKITQMKYCMANEQVTLDSVRDKVVAIAERLKKLQS